MDTNICFFMGYLVGTINPSYIISRIKGFDIRAKGSHNAGASNAVILLGKSIGILCALFDILKTVAVIALTTYLCPDYLYAFVLTGSACILGHIFPFYMDFRGGKGLACLGGMILSYNRRVFLVFLAAELVIVLVSNYICFVPVTASCAFSVVYAFMTRDWIGTLILTAVFVIIVFRHTENFRRIRAGTEMRISYLWNKEAELARLRETESQQ